MRKETKNGLNDLKLLTVWEDLQPLDAEGSPAMNRGQTVFAQILHYISHNEFHRCVQRYDGDRRVRKLTCWEQFLAMAFAQLTYREGLRDIEVSLAVHRQKLYHSGFRSLVKRSTLADANELRDWRIYADFAQSLIQIARPLYAESDLALDLQGTLYALDSTTIDLCLALFPWASFRRAKGAVKLHTMIDTQAQSPSSSILRTARFMTSKHWITSFRNPVPTLSWIVAIWISSVCTISTKR